MGGGERERVTVVTIMVGEKEEKERGQRSRKRKVSPDTILFLSSPPPVLVPLLVVLCSIHSSEKEKYLRGKRRETLSLSSSCLNLAIQFPFASFLRSLEAAGFIRLSFSFLKKGKISRRQQTEQLAQPGNAMQ